MQGKFLPSVLYTFNLFWSKTNGKLFTKLLPCDQTLLSSKLGLKGYVFQGEKKKEHPVLSYVYGMVKLPWHRQIYNWTKIP